MLAIERRNKIMEIITEKGSVMVVELSKIFSVTEETIRRDLEKLEKQGHLKRTHGGAVIIDEMQKEDEPVYIRETKNSQEKKLIAEKVLDFICDWDTIMLDSSTTALQVAKCIKNQRKITVITNSLKILTELADDKNIKLIATGGHVREKTLSLVGSYALETISKFNVNKSIICCKGLHLEKGLTESDEMEAEIKKIMTKNAKEVFLVVDNSKFDKVSFVKMLNLKDIDKVFTDKAMSEEWELKLNNEGVEIVYP